MPNEVISYLAMCQREGTSLQRGMNFGLGGDHSVILMSVRPNAPYNDRFEDDGTTLIYEGEQNGVAELSGTAGYPFFALDDSLLWSGKLRENVYLRYNVRISSLDEAWLELQGTAEIWIEE